MSQEIPTFMVNNYNSGIMMLAQQMRCRLEPHVMTESEQGERVSFDQVGVVGAVDITTRHADTPRIDVPHRRRWVSMVEFGLSDLLDWQDIIKVLNNPGGAYSKAFLAALNRKKDANIVSGMLGTTFTGKDGTIPVALPSGQIIVNGGTGFTLTKVEQAATLLMSKAVFEDDEELHIAWTRKQEEEFLRIPEVKSHDFNTQRVLMKGTISNGQEVFYGFQYHRLEDWTDHNGVLNRILPKVSTIRSCVAWVKSGVVNNTPQPPTVEVDKRPDKSNAWQYFAKISTGSARSQEEKVVQIDVVEP